MSYDDAIHKLGDWEGRRVDVVLRGDQSDDPHPVLSVAGELGPLVMDNLATRIEVKTGFESDPPSFTGLWLRPEWVSDVEALETGGLLVTLRIEFDNQTVLSISPH